MLDLLLPRRCTLCHAPGQTLCPACEGALVRLAPPVCARCGSPGAWPVERCAECAGRRLGFASARAAVVYDEPARVLVREWKEHGRRDLARRLAAIVAGVVPAPAADAATYVPGDRDRVLARGHSPPERLCAELAVLWSLPVRPLLLRSRNVPRQRGLTQPARRRNIRHAFTAIAAAPERLVLVDDVYTTGSTVDACATVLRQAGATRVDVVCLARAVR